MISFYSSEVMEYVATIKRNLNVCKVTSISVDFIITVENRSHVVEEKNATEGSAISKHGA